VCGVRCVLPDCQLRGRKQQRQAAFIHAIVWSSSGQVVQLLLYHKKTEITAALTPTIE